MELPVRNKQGEAAGSIDVSEAVWDAPMNGPVLHQVIVAQQANRRQGTHNTQTRGEVSYSTRKLRTQKHTGRARLGSRGSPSMGGSVAHGPHPRNYRQRLPIRLRRQALRIALSEKAREERVFVLDELSFDVPKTRQVKDLLARLGAEGSSLIVTERPDETLRKSLNNLPGVDSLAASLLNPLQTISVRNLVLTREAVRRIDELWAGPTTRPHTRRAAEVAA